MPPRPRGTAQRFPTYTWSARAGQYRDQAGRFVPRTAVRQAVDAALLERQRAMQALAVQLREGTISLDAWSLAMRESVKAVHLYSAAAAKGGWAQLDAADYGRVGRELRDQYRFLERLRREIESGAQALDGRFAARVELYAQSGRATYHAIERERERDGGATEVRSVLHPADHCAECVAEAQKSWQPLDDMVPIGARQCLSRCHCSAEYR